MATPSGLETIAQRSKYFFSIPLPTGNVLIDSLFLQARLVATPDVVAILDEFAEPRQIGPWIEEYAARTGGSRKTIAACVGQLLSQKLLWNLGDGDEETRIAAFAADYFDRNPLAENEPLRAVGSMHDRRRMNLYSLPVPRDVSSYAPLKHTVKLMMIGHCDAEFGLDVLRVAARDRNIDLELLLGHTEDPQLDEQIGHEKPQVLVVTTLTAKHALMAAEHTKSTREALAIETPYVAAARAELERLRRITKAPVLLHNLQVPILSPLGRADRGIMSHKARVVLTNLQLEALALEFPDVYIVDLEGALALHGKHGLVDETYGTFEHFGSLRWVTQTPESFKRDVHGIAPPWSQLADACGGGDVAEYDRIVANEQLDIVVSALALEPKKCVVVDLDGTLWPGVLADTGSPFALDSPPGHFEEQLGSWGFVGLYRGIHEALKALKDRGILLACVSKNDEDVVKQLWRYPKGFEEAMLKLEDFATYRINWDEKVDNILSIARELNLHPSSFVFVDDNPLEREKVTRFLPEVLVLGDNPFTIRWQLLTNALLQPATITAEARRRSQMVASQIERERLRASAVDQTAFRQSLNIECQIERATSADVDRVHELVSRTNQFNTTTRRYTKAELHELMSAEGGAVYTLRVRDRLTDYGLVGVCCVRGAEIELFAMSCRVIGLGVEDVFLSRIIDELSGRHRRLIAKYIPTDRNGPARNLLPSHGFTPSEGHTWEHVDETQCGAGL